MYVIYSITDTFVNTASFVIIVFAGFKNQAKVVLGTEMTKKCVSMIIPYIKPTVNDFLKLTFI